MSNHHGHHRSSHHSRSRMHHSSSSSHYQSMHARSRNSSSNINNGSGGIGSSHPNRGSQLQESSRGDHSGSYWTEHRSSSGKVYYYNTKTGVSQWELPAELRQQRPASPDSEISESSSIRQQQDKSPSSSASSHNSVRSDSTSEDKPLLTPSLTHYFKPELITSSNSSHIEELEQQANQLSRDSLLLNEKILKESVELKIARAVVHYVEISIEAQEKKYSLLRDTIHNFGFA